MTETDPKSDLRKEAYAARKLAYGLGLDADGQAHLLQEIGPVTGQVIAGYMPIRTEIDPIPVMTALCAANRICVPVIDGAGLPLRFREWAPGAGMVEGPFGAQVPATGDWLTPDVLIVPLVAFDAHCNRLGYGGGFYDRTLAGLREGQPTRAIGFAFAMQELPAVPTEPTDQRLDVIVTDQGVIRV